MVKVTCHHYKCMEMLCLGLFSLKNGIKYLSMSLFCFRLVTCSLLQRSWGGFLGLFFPSTFTWMVCEFCLWQQLPAVRTREYTLCSSAELFHLFQWVFFNSFYSEQFSRPNTATILYWLFLLDHLITVPQVILYIMYFHVESCKYFVPGGSY